MPKHPVLRDSEGKEVKLPTLPGIALKILEAANGQASGVNEIAKIIACDPPLSAKMLSVANSPFFGLETPVCTVQQALAFLGLNTAVNLALSFSLLNRFSNRDRSPFDYRRFWKESLVGAMAAQAIAEAVRTPLAGSTFFIGLLQNIGSLILAESRPRDYAQVVADTSSGDLPLHSAERQHLGIDHMALGGQLFQAWGLPELFSTGIRYHHHNGELPTRSGPKKDICEILQLSALFIELFSEPDSRPAAESIRIFLERRSYPHPISVESIAEAISEKIKVVFPMFEIDVDEKEHIRIIEAAKESLTQLSGDLIMQLHSQSKEMKVIRRMAEHDGLTGLYNQKKFRELLDQESGRAVRYRTPLSLVMVDIDHFKSVNDFYGHLAGDLALKTIAGHLKRELRESDLIARYGGEEFAVILPSIGLEEAVAVVERLMETINALIISHNGKSFSLTASYGIASLTDYHQPTSESLLSMADEALYEAKNGGRNRYCCFKQPVTSSQKPTVMVVDDDDFIQVAVPKMLERLGCSVVSAKGGQEAIDYLQTQAERIDMVLLDVGMPGLSAEEILSDIKRKNPNTRVFISSGFAVDDIGKGLISKAEGFLQKPYGMKELSQTIGPAATEHSQPQPQAG